MPLKDSNERQKSSSVKLTYMSRNKARGSREQSTDKFVGPSTSTQATSRKPSSPAKSDVVFKAPDDPIPIVDFRTETSPKRMDAGKDIEASEKPATITKMKLRQSRSSSSNIPAQDTSTKTVPSGTSWAKPGSVSSKVSQNTHRSQTPVSESNYDNTSMADSAADSNSISTGRIKRTEAERKQYLENEPECSSIEAHRALCTRCKKWVRLSSRQAYSVKPWELHRTRCDQKMPVKPTYKNLGLVASLPFVVPRTEKVRKALLELDDTAEIVEPEQIKCRICQQWIQLEKKYSLKGWAAHTSACDNNLEPTNIEKMLERKLYFFCDVQFKSFLDPHLVECAFCNQAIALNPNVDYDIDTWLLHKTNCQHYSESHQDPGATKNTLTSPDKGSHSQEGEAELTPIDQLIPESQTQPVIPKSHAETKPNHARTMSTTDSERTLVPSSSVAILGSSTSIAAAAASTSGSNSPKRKRESSTDEPQLFEDSEMSGERPSRRPRTENYFPDDRDIPSGLEWFLLPFKAFVEGFKESLTTLDSSSSS